MDEIISQHRGNGGIRKYKSLTRTTLAETDNLPRCGIYILAYMGTVIYVGLTKNDIAQRLTMHWRDRYKEQLGDWLDRMQWDWINIRLDVLEAPDDHAEYWLKQAEAELVRRFKPVFNSLLQGERQPVQNYQNSLWL